MPLIDTFGPLVISSARGYSDFRWEREWRKQGSLKFANDDVAFGICPDHEIFYFQKSVNNAFPFIDPDWNESKLKSHLNAFGATKLLSVF